MKRILLRSKTTPFEIFDPVTYIEKDKCSSNIGNLLYQHGVYKHLSHPSQILEINNNSVNTKKSDFINSNYDHFVIPLANAFRPSYEKTLKKLSNFIKTLNIPVTVVGVGAQTDANNDLKNLNIINKTVKEFLTILFDKGNSIGVRGETTKAYIESLGFYNKAEVIGCPSLFTFPNNIRGISKGANINDDSRIALNLSAPGKQAAFSNYLDNFEKIFKFNFYKYKNTYYIPQETRSLELLTYGLATKKGIEHSILDAKTANDLFSRGNVKFFLNSYSWFNFLKSCNLTFGTRLHGCIASLISGTPAMLFAHDSRTLEIAQYFKLPYLELNNIREVIDAKEIYDAINLEPLKDIYDLNLKRYANFLRKNGLETIVDDDKLMAEFDKNILDEHLNLSVEPLIMNPQSVGLRLHWLKSNYDSKIVKKK